MRRLLALVDAEPALFAAYARIRVDAQDESVRILVGRSAPTAYRIRVPRSSPRPPPVSSPPRCAWWARGAGDDDRGSADLAALVERAYDALTGEAADAAAQCTAAQ
ncbi:hypothetical protein SGLAM104S_08806 [Streptomyces glaucescens]